jgi:serine protease inhibitor
MLVVLPEEVDGLRQVEQTLSVKTLGRWVASMSPVRVNVTMPTFTFRWGGSVGTELEHIGIVEAFRNRRLHGNREGA